MLKTLPGYCWSPPVKLKRFIMRAYTEQVFPIPAGTVLTLSCEEDFHLIGSKTLTCQHGEHYYHGENEGEPKCEPSSESGNVG